jgi:hypothetical protein
VLSEQKVQAATPLERDREKWLGGQRRRSEEKGMETRKKDAKPDKPLIWGKTQPQQRKNQPSPRELYAGDGVGNNEI